MNLPEPLDPEPVRPLHEAQNWHRNAVFYEVLLGSYADSNADGIGDFQGLRSRLGYLAWLGIDCLWIPPFYPSPQLDGGYDISDYTGIDPKYGTLEDFQALIEDAHALGIRIVIDMVMNHTSSEHPWFQASREEPDGFYGDYYVWRDEPDAYQDARIIFVDTEHSNWTYDEVRGQYYWHRFFSHQPDLNFENPHVRESMREVVRYWCSLGVDGIRLDAIPYLFEEDGTNCENLPETHEFICDLRQMIDEEFPGVIMIAEANQPPEEVVDYFGTDANPECHICFHFPIMPRLFAAMQEETSKGVKQILAQLPPLPSGGQWGTFLRNHDELTLEMVTDRERRAMYGWYAPQDRMRANVGIRRRLASLLGSSRRRIELAHALLLALPGSPFLYYGDEIAMGDNIWLHDRDGVRTPMQWDASEGAGFSEADPKTFRLPLIDTPAWDYRAVNVEEAWGRPTSLLNWLRRTLAIRKSYPVFGVGQMTLVHTSDDAILAFTRRDESDTVLCVYNLAGTPHAVNLWLPGMAVWRTVDMYAGNPFPTVDANDELTLTLGRHTFYWLRMKQPEKGDDE